MAGERIVTERKEKLALETIVERWAEETFAEPLNLATKHPYAHVREQLPKLIAAIKRNG